MADPGPACAYLDFLSDELANPSLLLADLLDTQTLRAADPLLGFPPFGLDEATKKRLAEHDSDKESDDEKPEGGPGGRDTKRVKTESSNAKDKDAARNKATREKARREKINERFAELAALIDPGSEPKTDKPTILADTIKYVQQMRVEHHQLRQLNKFLEERVAQYERERGQQLYQQMLQHPGLGLPGMMPTGLHMPGPGMPGPSTLPPPGASSSSMLHHPSLHTAHAMAAAAAAAASTSTPPLPHSSLGHQPSSGLDALQGAGSSTPAGYPGMSLTPHPGTSTTPAPLLPAPPGPSDPAASQLTTAGSGGKGLLGTGVPGMVAGAAHAMRPAMMNNMPIPQPYWVPPNMLDSKQDSLLRPPAA